MINTKELDEIVIGRVEPYIYAFSTNTIPNYLKIGDTYRPISERLNEWKYHFPKLKKEYESTAKIDDNVYFRDFAVHEYLEKYKHKTRLIPTLFPNEYFSKEFFKDTDVKDIEDAIKDIKNDYTNKTQKYHFYNAVNRLPKVITYSRVENYEPRIGTQDVTISNFKQAIKNGRDNLLMYAVMRFGKSFTAMCCATEMDAKLVVIVSGKADIKSEWKKTVESHIRFVDYLFVSSDELSRDEKLISNTLKSGKKIVVFLTLQDLMGKEIKDKHKDLFENSIDLLLVDESHFGARAEKYGEVLKKAKVEKDVKNDKDTEDIADLDEINEKVKVLKPKITIHMSGTPYRILMSDEFEKEDIIAFYQFTDIVDEQKKWDKENLLKDDTKEWDNPYFGFPQMIRFAFNPNKSTLKKLEELKSNGYAYAFSELLKPKSIKKSKDNLHKEFKYEKEVLELLEVIDGSKKEDNLLSFLDYDKIKEGKLCSHIVIVLPYCSSCDALEKLIKTNKQKFKNLNQYEIINIAGLDSPKEYSKVVDVKRAISGFEIEGKKTISLTVNRMLTGCTVPEWDTMIYLKDTSSPQEYDQSIFRLQSQFVKNYIDKDNNKIKINMKPQTLLVDFEPGRMFAMQEAKSQIYNVNTDEAGNSKLKERLEKELKISPIFTLNKDKISQVSPNNILDAISNYKKDKGIKEEALAIPVDLEILNIEEFRKVIELENEIDSKAGLVTPAYSDGNGDDLDTGKTEEDNNNKSKEENKPKPNDTSKDSINISLSKKIQSYYTRILLFSFLTKSKVISLGDILSIIDESENSRIAKNLGLRKRELEILNNNYNKWALRKLDYSIQDLNSLSESADINTALKKFGKLGEAIVITPNNICDKMVNLLPNDLFVKSQINNSKYLDIAGTSGEFALSLYNKMKANKLDDNYIKNAIYTIPKSSICYELTRKLYELLKLNIDNISTIYAQDIIKNIDDYNKIKSLLTQDKKFCEISLADTISKGGHMKFDAIVGNPPYQENVENRSEQPPVYHLFYDISFELSNKVSLITPARFLFNAGKTPKEWNKKILNDIHFKVIRYEENSKDIFPTVDIKGGVAITYRDTEKNFGAIKIFVKNNIMSDIVTKICNSNFEGLNEIIYSNTSYKYSKKLREDYPEFFIKDSNNIIRLSGGSSRYLASSVFEKLPELFYDNKPNDTFIKIIGRQNNHRTEKFIDLKYLIPPYNFDKYKVFISSSNGTGEFGETLTTPYVVEPFIGSTETYLSIGAFNNRIEADNLVKYIKTKFVRAMLGTLKVTQGNKNADVWNNVPSQDFSNNSDIDWEKSISEIDKQLYEKYNLSKEEIDFIETKVKPMK